MLYKHRTVLIISLLIVVIIIGAWITYTILNSFQKVTVSYNTMDVQELDIYKAIEARGEVTKNGDKIQSITSGKEYSIKKGLYVLIPSGKAIKTDPIRLDLADTPVVMNLDIDYTDSHLQQLYKNDEQLILSALSSYPNLTNVYSINKGTLYHHGEYFGTTLSYIGSQPLMRDTLKVILKKENASWKVLVTPRITISRADFPQVPVTILRQVNAIDLGYPLMPGMSPEIVAPRPGA